MELLQLRYFYETAKNENIARAAEKYMIPASSVSASVKRLEEELGCKLFERQSNRIFLNENGKLLQNSLGVIFEELDRTVSKIKNREPMKTEIRILILAMQDYVSRLMLRYQELHPNVHFIAMFDTSNRECFDYDIIIDKPCDDYTEYRRRELGNYQICFKAVSDHPLVGKPLTMRDLRNERFVTLEIELGANSILFDCCKNAGFYPNIVLQTNDRQCFTESTAAGVGLGLWLESALDPAPRGLVDLDVRDMRLSSSVCLYYKQGILDDQLNGFVEYLADCDF